MTRIFVPRGSAGCSSSNPSRSSTPGPSSSRTESQVPIHQAPSAVKDEEVSEDVKEQVATDEFSEFSGSSEIKAVKNDDDLHVDQNETSIDEIVEVEKLNPLDASCPGEMIDDVGSFFISEGVALESEGSSSGHLPIGSGSQHPPPPPVPPPKPFAVSSNSRRSNTGSSSPARSGSARRAVAWPTVSTKTLPSEPRPSSPRSHGESEGYNSADEQNPCSLSSCADVERERQFEIDIRRAKGLEVKRMLEDGNCLFRAVADQVYGESDSYDLTRQMCIDYMEQDRDHYSQFITEGFTSYCMRKRRDKVYGNNVEIQALSEMYNRPIHIYSYSTEPINIFHGTYNTDSPPIRLSYHYGNHYNSLVDPHCLTIGDGLGFSSLRGGNVDKDQVKAAIKAQQDQQIDNALLAEGQLYSDLELTEKEIERMVMEKSRAEYLSSNKLKPQVSLKESSTSSTAEPSSSGPSGSESKRDEQQQVPSSVQIVLTMGFSYLQAMEAYSIFGDDVDSMICYLVETGSSSSGKGKSTK